MAVQASSSTDRAVPGADRVLTDDALAFVADLQRRFGATRLDLLHRREERQTALAAGEVLDFLPGTREIREADWTVAPAPADFDDRRVEITGPAEPKMMINALNSGARVFMADLEDALSPTWANVVGGQAALMDAVRGTLAFDSPEGKAYRVGERPAQLVVRPRGWHLIESHVLVDGVPVSASLFDAGLYLFHNAAERVARGSGPYLYLPKLESHHEARLWNEVFIHAQAALGVPRGSRARDRAHRDHHAPRSRWTRSCTSCASTPRASMPAAGTTCSASSSGSTRSDRVRVAGPRAS